MSAIRCVILDVDGVLTDGRLIVHDNGSESRAFHVLDGFAISWYRRLGGMVIFCSGKSSPAVEVRGRELKVDHIVQGSSDKVADMLALFESTGLRFDEAAIVGDDLPDVGLMQRCGYPIAVANAIPEVARLARYVTRARGGRGAVREALEHIMRRDGTWLKVLQHYGAAPAPAPNS